MIQPHQRILSILAVSALALGLAACGKKDDQTAGQQLDSAVARTEQAASDAQLRAEEAAKSAGTRIEEGAARMGEAASNAASSALDVAGDATTTAEIKAELVKDSELSALQINVDTQGGTVTLNGTAPSDTAKARAEDIAKAVKGVVAVNNLLTVQPQ
ncbi:BON domain-containing protein [Pantoea sp. 18069]|uniref:BON domain-containing protein n=1 Tax=Pantoea sp. 18069 TaxID=2681415 RepID=UPI00135A4B16|nr:BON domain-containing protein [Pantoea sp. 18069]